MTYNLEYFRGKRVLVTGHTGFKGSWLCSFLRILGAKVYGFAQAPPTNPNLYSLLDLDNRIVSEVGDIADYSHFEEYYREIKPDAVFHLAAQPLVREGYEKPRETYVTNVLGTTNVMECVRLHGAESVLNVTTDKVYENNETGRFFSETDPLNGYDPYSNSKSCSELITQTYVRSFPNQMCPTSTARAGNVIGGGDFGHNRIIPDCVRAAISNMPVLLRNPNSIRPYQHVLEPLFAYLTIVAKQAVTHNSKSYNIGPNKEDCISTGMLADMFCKSWGEGLRWEYMINDGPHEANYLKLDNQLIKNELNVTPIWNISDAINKTVEWTKVWHDGGDVINCTERQIKEYLIGRDIYV